MPKRLTVPKPTVVVTTETRLRMEELCKEAVAYFREMDYWADRYNEIIQEMYKLGFYQAGEVWEYMAGNICEGGGNFNLKEQWILELATEDPQPAHFNEDECKYNDAKPAVSRAVQTYRNKVLRFGASVGWICIYCQYQGTPESGPDGRGWHLDHLFPKARGGDSLPDNIILSCATCNLKKNSALASEILFQIKARLEQEKVNA